MPGLGEFLYRPMAAGVAFAMISAYVLSRSFVPSRSARWLKPHAAHGHGMRMEMETATGDHDDHDEPFGASPVPEIGTSRASDCFAAPSPVGNL